MKKGDQLMSINEVCKTLNISRATLYTRIKQGRITPEYVVNHALDRVPPHFRQEEVDRLRAPAPVITRSEG